MAGRVSNEFIQELLSRVDIVSVINSQVPLTQAGREYKACCPFHNEKTPSFYVSPAKQFYHCFGCGESGTAIQFMMNYGNYRFLDAVEELAASVGMKVPRTYSGSPQHGDFNILLELMAKVSSAYQNQLYQSTSSAQAKKYLKARDITPEVARQFELGYAPDEWDFLLKKFGRNEKDKVLLEKAGLIIRKENKTYDRFRGRLMFPIEDRRGRVIGFGGRVIGEGEPKYLNSPETILFKKGNELFGFKKALRAIKNEERVLVVEGYTDVVGLAQFGVSNAIATLGTAVTPFHVKELFRAADEVVFCFDGDFAGNKAAWRAMQTTLPAMQDGHMVSFVFLPEGQDPDSMVREEGAQAFRERMSQGEPITEFIFRGLLRRSDISRTDGKAKFAKEFGKVIAELKGGHLRRMMIAEVAKLTGMSESSILSVLGPGETKRVIERSVPSGMNLHTLAGKSIVMLVQHPELGQLADELEDVGLLPDPNSRLLAEVLRYIQREPEIKTAQLVENFRATEYFDQIRMFASENYFSSNSSDGALEAEFKGIVMRLRERVTRQKTQNLLSNPDSQLEDADLQDALQQMKDDYFIKRGTRAGPGKAPSGITEH